MKEVIRIFIYLRLNLKLLSTELGRFPRIRKRMIVTVIYGGNTVNIRFPACNSEATGAVGLSIPVNIDPYHS